MSTVLRPTINDDHIILTMKLDVDWRKVPVQRRVEFLKTAELTAEVLQAQFTTPEIADA